MSDTPRLVVGPFNRVEGDLEVHLDLAGGRVAAARVNSPLYRGFERMLEGRAPSDALTLTPRICGICSISQSAAAARALGAAMGLAPTDQGAWLAALIHAVENVSDHLVHFNLFFMPDFTRPCYAARPWYPRAVARFAGGSRISRRLPRSRICCAGIAAMPGFLWKSPPIWTWTGLAAAPGAI